MTKSANRMKVKRTSSSSPKRGKSADTSADGTGANFDGTASSMGMKRKRPLNVIK